MNKSPILQYYEKLSAVYDTETKKRAWTPNEKLKEVLMPLLHPGDLVLDVGVGTGQTAELLLERGCSVVGIDISADMLAIARHKFPQIELYEVDMEADLAVLEGKTFDAIVSMGTLEFVKDLPRSISDLCRYLKDGGYFCFTYEEYIPDSDLQKWKVSQLGMGLIDPIPEYMSFLVHRHSFEEIEDIVKAQKMAILQQYSFTGYVKTEQRIPVHYGMLLAQK